MSPHARTSGVAAPAVHRVRDPADPGMESSVSDRMLPSGSTNQAILSPPGAVHTPRLVLASLRGTVARRSALSTRDERVDRRTDVVDVRQPRTVYGAARPAAATAVMRSMVPATLGAQPVRTGRPHARRVNPTRLPVERVRPAPGRRSTDERAPPCWNRAPSLQTCRGGPTRAVRATAGRVCRCGHVACRHTFTQSPVPGGVAHAAHRRSAPAQPDRPDQAPGVRPRHHARPARPGRSVAADLRATAPDDALQLVFRKGIEHESAYLERLRSAGPERRRDRHPLRPRGPAAGRGRDARGDARGRRRGLPGDVLRRPVGRPGRLPAAHRTAQRARRLVLRHRRHQAGPPAQGAGAAADGDVRRAAGRAPGRPARSGSPW